MSQRLSRREIKHDIREDSVLLTINKAFAYISENARLLIWLAVGVVVLFSAVAAVRYMMAARQAEAGARLGEVAEVLQAPIVAVGANPDDPDRPTFASATERGERARPLLEQLRADYGNTGAARVAAVHLGRIELDAGNPDAARALWSEFLSEHDDHMLAASVKVSLIELDRAAGRGEAVVEELRSSLETDDALLPQDLALYQLGLTLEQLDRHEEAVEEYRRLGDEYPESPFASTATLKVQELGGGGPSIS